MRFVWVILCLLITTSAAAQEVRDCRDIGHGAAIIDPSEMKGRSYANGEVTIAVIHDGRRRSSDSLFVIVFAPDRDHPDQKQCRMIGTETGYGYANVRLEAAQADFTAADGLTVLIPARIFLEEDGVIDTTMLSVNVNRATDKITATQELSTE